MPYRKLRLMIAPIIAIVLGAVAATSVTPAQDIQVIQDADLKPSSTVVGGASPLATTRTVQHWFGTSLNPDNGITYGFNMVGADPGTNSPATIPTDIIPLNIVVDQYPQFSFNGVDVVVPTLMSPLFVNGDFATTTAATNAAGGKGPGGNLSAGNNGVMLQDATMRSQFNKTGTGYHLYLGQPFIHGPITIVVPKQHGTLLQSPRGVVFADVNIQWFAAQLQQLNASLGYIDPTHLPIYLTNGMMLYVGSDPLNCCVIGFHGAGIVPGRSNGSGNGQGNQPVQTYAWGSYISPGVFNPNTDWALQDIHALSHEIAEWADDPFVNNFVEPWLTPTAPQYGCTNVLETGDPVVGIGFSKGVNTFKQGPVPNGERIADGTYHPEDEVFLPWFMRTAPNTISQPTQATSSNIGRYTLMGDLNPFAGFRRPATGC